MSDTAVSTAPVTAAEHKKITLTFWNSDERPVFKKSFIGRWLVGAAHEGERADDDSQHWDAGAEWSVAESAKGAIVVYTTHCNDGFAPEMAVYDSFADFRDASGEGAALLYPQNIIAAVADALGEDYEIELDL